MVHYNEFYGYGHSEKWRETHRRLLDFHPEFVLKQKSCCVCHFDFKGMDAKQILYHYVFHQEVGGYRLVICDVCGIPVYGRKRLKAHKQEKHSV